MIMHIYEAHYDEVFSGGGPLAIAQEVGRYEHASSYMTLVNKRHLRHPVYGVLFNQLAHLMDEVDPLFGVDEEKPHFNNFLWGSSPAIDVVTRYLSHEFQQQMAGHAIASYSCSPEAMPEKMEERAKQQGTLAGQITDVAERGWAAAQAYHDTLEDLFGKFQPGVIRRITMQRGFGFVMGVVLEVRDARQRDDEVEIAKAASSIQGDPHDPKTKKEDIVDWDKALHALTIEIAHEDERNRRLEE